MSTFDIVINLLEASLEVLFIYLVLQKSGKYLSLVLFSLLDFMAITLCNYALLPELLLTLSSILVLFLYATLLNKRGYIQNIFLILFISILGNISINVSILFAALFFEFPFYEGNAYFFVVILSKILLIVLIYLSSQYINKYQLIQTKKLEFILLSLLALDMIYSSFSDIMFYDALFNKNVIIALICVNLLAVFLFIVFIEQQKEQDERLTIQRNLLELKTQEQLYKENIKNIEKLNKWKHDMKHVFNSIHYSLNNNQLNEIDNIINEYTHILDIHQLTLHTSNELLDYIIIPKLNIIKVKDIQFEVINNIENNIPLSDIHFSIILGNLLDNAIENCGEGKHIFIDVGNVSGFFIIKVSNSIDYPILKDNPHLKTTKKDKNKHGIGLNSVKLLVEKYDGNMNIDDSHGYFSVKIVF